MWGMSCVCVWFDVCVCCVYGCMNVCGAEASCDDGEGESANIYMERCGLDV